MTPVRHVVLATAGHVDHGKSALVRALTGTDPDRLPEEKARGITIDLGFAHLTLDTATGTLDVGVVDVPGHEDFVRNMVAGVATADAALLVIAADDGPMPQTQEHVEILTYLGVGRCVVALTKADLAADLDAAVMRVRQWLGRTAYADATVVPTSVRDGRGLDDLRSALGRVLAEGRLRSSAGGARLAVDRVFSPRGVGTVVTGTLTGGPLSRGQSVVVQPDGVATRVRSLQTFGRTLQTAEPGTRVAANLQDLAVDTTTRGKAIADTRGVARGDVVTLAHVGVNARVLDVLLRRTSDAAGPLLRTNARVRLYYGTASVPARVRLLEGNDLNAGATALARLTPERPVPAVLGDRLLLRSDSQQHTLAGGLVLDLDPPRRQKDRQLRLLRSRVADPSLRWLMVGQVARDGVVVAERLATLAGTSPEAVVAVARETAGVRVHANGTALVDADVWQSMVDVAVAEVDAFHAAHPDQRGPAIAAVRIAVSKFARTVGVAGVRDGVAADVLAALEQNGFARAGDVIARAAHRPALPPALQAAGEALRLALEQRPFDPPSRKDLCRTPATTQAMHFLLSTGQAVDAGADLVLSASAYAAAVTKVREYLSSGPAATVSELKELLGSSRRVMVPLLELFDRNGITQRNGNTRTLR